MKVGVFGTGRVGEAIGTKLVSMGHEVRMGSRSAGNEKASAWAAAAGARASTGTFADAAEFGELLFNCTPGTVSLEVLESAGRAHLRGKVLVDVANPLVFAKGAPPSLFVTNDDSLGERLQRAHPELLVVKTLNTVHCSVMVDPSRVPGEHTMFLCGNDAGAKARVRELLRDIGWRDVIDLGDITNARATEALLPLWVRALGCAPDGRFQCEGSALSALEEHRRRSVHRGGPLRDHRGAPELPRGRAPARADALSREQGDHAAGDEAGGEAAQSHVARCLPDG